MVSARQSADDAGTWRQHIAHPDGASIQISHLFSPHLDGHMPVVVKEFPNSYHIFATFALIVQCLQEVITFFTAENNPNVLGSSL
jgi:hypothetical protein